MNRRRCSVGLSTEAVRRALKTDAVLQSLKSADLEPHFQDAAAYRQKIDALSVERRKIVERAGITVN